MSRSPAPTLVLLASLLATACANGPSPTGSSSDPDPGSEASGGLAGELSAVSIFDSQGARSMEYFLHTADGARDVRLLFDRDPGLTSQTPLRVFGVREAGDGEALRVSRFELTDPAAATATQTGALIGQPSKTRTVAWVQMDVNGGGVMQTRADATRIIFGQNAGPLFGTRAGDKSVAQYYDENSYGMLKLTGQVEGPDAPIPFTGTACNNFDPLARDVSGKVTAMGRTYDHYYLYWGSMQNCGPGWGAQGTQSRPGKYVWLNTNGTFCTATGQEIGHNFGLMHASTMDCGTAIMANDTSTCTSNEYGNPMTVMGGGCRHLISVEKWYSGFFQGCNAVKARVSGTFTLLPIETACNGIQAIQIPFPTGAPARTTTTSQSNGNVTVRFYYLELRSSIGMDTGIKPGVYVHVAPDVPAATANGPRTFMLDMNPATTAFDPMTAGQTYTDPAGGVSFTVDSFDANKATVRVEITGGTGANTCFDGSTLAGTGPDTCGAGPATGTGGAGGGGGAGGAAGAGGAGGAAGSGGAGGAGGARADAGADGPRDAGGTGGTAGTGGAGGAGGARADAGADRGATGGTAGAGGATGAGGTAGTGGATGTGGTAGTGGATGTGGTTGTGGSAGTGAGGVAGTGTGGTTGATGGTSGGVDAGKGPGEVAGGCGCDVGLGGNRSGTGMAIAVAGLGLVVARRRRSRS